MEPDAFALGLFDLFTGGGDFIDVLQAIHMNFRHAFANRLTGHVQSEAHLVGRFRLARGQLSSAEAAWCQCATQFRLAHAGKFFRLP